MILQARDYALFRKAAWEYHNNPSAANGILFKCFNQEEAMAYKKAMGILYPDVPVHVSWLEFVCPQSCDGDPSEHTQN